MTFQTTKSHPPAPLERKKTRPKQGRRHIRDICKAAGLPGAFLAKEGFCDKWNLSFYDSVSAFTNANPVPFLEYHCLKLVPVMDEDGEE